MEVGVLLTHKFLESGVFNLFDNEFLQKKHDGAFLNLKGPVAFTSAIIAAFSAPFMDFNKDKIFRCNRRVYK